MGRILSRTGVSLADQYDIEGSIAGVERLESKEVHLVHEMGAVIFAERMSGRIRRAQTGGITQSTAFNTSITDMPGAAVRLLALQAFVSDATRLTHMNISLGVSQLAPAQDIPVWAWNLGDPTRTVSLTDDGSIVTSTMMLPVIDQVPNLLIGDLQAFTVNEINIRGFTEAFGAGTIVMTILAYLAFSSAERDGGLSSVGVPFPGW